MTRLFFLSWFNFVHSAPTHNVSHLTGWAIRWDWRGRTETQSRKRRADGGSTMPWRERLWRNLTHPPPPSFSSSSSSVNIFFFFGSSSSSLLYPLRKGVAWLGQSARWQHWLYMEKKRIGRGKVGGVCDRSRFFLVPDSVSRSTLLQVKRVVVGGRNRDAIIFWKNNNHEKDLIFFTFLSRLFRLGRFV